MKKKTTLRDRLHVLFDSDRSITYFVIGTATLTIALQAPYGSAKLVASGAGSKEIVGAWVLAVVLFIVSAVRV